MSKREMDGGMGMLLMFKGGRQEVLKALLWAFDTSGAQWRQWWWRRGGGVLLSSESHHLAMWGKGSGETWMS